MNTINKLYKVALVLGGIVMLLFLFSCSSQKKEEEQTLHFNPELSKLSLSLAIIDRDTSINAEFYCLDWHPTDYKALPDEEGDKLENEAMRQNVIDELKKQKAEEEALCIVYKKAQAYTSKVADIALRTRKVPSDGFLFVAFIGTSSEERDDIYEEETIGLFESLEECKAAEKILRDCDIGTRKCRPWKSSEIYKLDEIQAKKNK